MKIWLLYNLNEHNAWYEADFDDNYTIKILQHTICEIFPQSELILLQSKRDNYAKLISTIEKSKFDIIFNITEWYPWESRESVWPIILEQLCVQYTWPRPKNLAITLDKNCTKKLLQQKLKNFLINDYLIFSKIPITKDYINKICNGLNFPLFIKYNSEGSSLGIDTNSIVYNKNDLFEKILEMREKAPFTDILVEEYIDGVDISVSYVEGSWFFWPVQYSYSNGKKIYDYEMKIFDYNNSVEVLQSNFSNNSEIIELSKTIVNELNIEWYARLEFRISKENIFFLEINNQLCLMPENAFMEAIIKNSNYSYKDIIEHIIKYKIQNPISYPLY